MCNFKFPLFETDVHKGGRFCVLKFYTTLKRSYIIKESSGRERPGGQRSKEYPRGLPVKTGFEKCSNGGATESILFNLHLIHLFTYFFK
jgi:hypothetical protein